MRKDQGTSVQSVEARVRRVRALHAADEGSAQQPRRQHGYEMARRNIPGIQQVVQLICHRHRRRSRGRQDNLPETFGEYMACRAHHAPDCHTFDHADKSDAAVSFKNAPTEEERRSKRIEGVPKAFRINYSDLVQHGFTDGCRQCDHNAMHQKSKAGLPHTAVCRTRLLGAFMNALEGRVRLEAY